MDKPKEFYILKPKPETFLQNTLLAAPVGTAINEDIIESKIHVIEYSAYEAALKDNPTHHAFDVTKNAIQIKSELLEAERARNKKLREALELALGCVESHISNAAKETLAEDDKGKT